MPDKNLQSQPEQKQSFNQQVDAKISRKIKAQKHTHETIWLGLGMMGLIGWSVAIPMVLGAMLGLWIDKNWPSHHSWTLMLLMLGLIMGCANAWHWVDKEQQAIDKHQKDLHD